MKIALLNFTGLVSGTGYFANNLAKGLVDNNVEIKTIKGIRGFTGFIQWIRLFFILLFNRVDCIFVHDFFKAGMIIGKLLKIPVALSIFGAGELKIKKYSKLVSKSWFYTTPEAKQLWDDSYNYVPEGEPIDPKILAEKIEWTINNYDKAKEKAQNAYTKFKKDNYSSDAVAKKLIYLINKYNKHDK